MCWGVEVLGLRGGEIVGDEGFIEVTHLRSGDVRGVLREQPPGCSGGLPGWSLSGMGGTQEGDQGFERDQLPISVIAFVRVWDCSAMPFCRLSLILIGSVIQGSLKAYSRVIQGLSCSDPNRCLVTDHVHR